MPLFGPKLPIDRDELEWQLATFKWLALEFGGIERSADAGIFPPAKAAGKARVA